MNARITYWLDTTDDDQQWIVDIEDADGADTLSQHDSEESARREALRQAARRGLNCFFVDSHGLRIPK